MSNRIWVPKNLANGRLHPMKTLKAVAGLGRRDNATREMLWCNRAINARCGTPSAKNGMALLADLAEAGVVTSYRQRSAGVGYTVEFAAVPYTERLELPPAALWKHKWKGDDVQGPRYGKETAQVLRWLLAVIIASDFQPGNMQVVHDRGRADICDRSGLSRDGYDRAWAVVRRVCVDDPWISWEETEWDEGGQGPHIITIDWTLLPDLIDPPSKAVRVKRAKARIAARPIAVSAGVGRALSADGGQAQTADRDRQIVRQPIEGASSSRPVLSKPVPSSQMQSERHSLPRARQEAERTESSFADTQARDVIRQGLMSHHAGDVQADNRTEPFESWLLTTVAVLADVNSPNRLGLSQSDVRMLRGLLRPRYEDGWTPGNLAAALTREAPPRSTSGALRHRIKELPEQTNYVPVATSRKALDGRRAFEERARSRSADKYTQRTM